MINTLAYHGKDLLTAVKGFYVTGPRFVYKCSIDQLYKIFFELYFTVQRNRLECLNYVQHFNYSPNLAWNAAFLRYYPKGAPLW